MIMITLTGFKMSLTILDLTTTLTDHQVRSNDSKNCCLLTQCDTSKFIDCFL